MIIKKAPIIRRKSIPVRVGNVTIGGDAPIVVQSMTNTDTANIAATVEQIKQLADAGSEIVRITVDTEAVGRIKQQLLSDGYEVPLSGDFHYIGHTLLTDYPDCARALDKYRINPGNVGFGKKHDSQFSQMIQKAIEYDKPVRIGVNWGSLDQALLTELMNQNAKRSQPHDSGAVLQEALVLSALNSAQLAETLGLTSDKIIISCKVSAVQDLIAVYQDLAKRCDYALHLGLTEAGMKSKGIVATSAAFGVLLQQGIGDTIRASLTPEPGGDRTLEVQVCQEILQTIGLRAFNPLVTACPGCGRTTSTVFQHLADKIQTYVKQNMPSWRSQYPGVESLQIAVMGCIVNGPGESKQADIGISLPGTGETPAATVFIDGKKVKTLRGEHIAEEFQQLLTEYIHQRYS